MRAAAALAVLALAGPALALPLAPEVAPSAFAGYGPCAGHAPSMTSCTSGSHVHGGAVNQAVWNGGFTGAVYSVLSHAGGSRFFACTFDGTPNPLKCWWGGVNPPAGAAFSHACFTTELDLATPGGEGLWGCEVRHGLLA